MRVLRSKKGIGPRMIRAPIPFGVSATRPYPILPGAMLTPRVSMLVRTLPPASFPSPLMGEGGERERAG